MAHREFTPRPHHHSHRYHGLGFTSVRSTAYLASMLFTPELKNPKLRLLARAAIITGAGFLERELWRRGHEHSREDKPGLAPVDLQATDLPIGTGIGKTGHGPRRSSAAMRTEWAIPKTPQR
jgi:hypothetical protein